MPICNLKDMLAAATAGSYAAVQFNTDCLEITQAILATAESERAPVIVGLAQAAAKDGKIESMAAVVRDHASRSSLPICLHLDHSTDPEQIARAVAAGFTSVMVDGSMLPLDDNIEVTRRVVDACRPAGVSVEAELGSLPGSEDGGPDDHAAPSLVEIDSIRRFVDAVPVDALAVAVGNAHGNYVGEPDIDFDLLSEAAEIAGVPLVLHGGTGIPDAMLRRSIQLGIRKINVGTEIREGYMDGFAEGLSLGEGIYGCFARGRRNVSARVASKLVASSSSRRW